MTVEPRKSLPAAVARQLRQEAGFGCCKCGTPILQYHHIVEWAEEEHFRPEDMMVLCPLHHDQATKGAMPAIEQRQMKSAPHNIQRGHDSARARTRPSGSEARLLRREAREARMMLRSSVELGGHHAVQDNRNTVGGRDGTCRLRD